MIHIKKFLRINILVFIIKIFIMLSDRRDLMNPKVKVRLRIIAILTTLIWMIVIFRFSMDTGVSSHELSDFCVQVFNKAVYHFTGKDL